MLKLLPSTCIPIFRKPFEEKSTYIQPVFDNFNIVKNFNDNAVGEVRKDEQCLLYMEGSYAADRALKKTKHILTSS